MERTELREAFFAETRNDPYAHMIATMYADAWADGYEQALRDNDLTEQRLSKTYADRRTEAFERLTDARREAEVKMVVALAETGRLIGGPKPT